MCDEGERAAAEALQARPPWPPSRCGRGRGFGAPTMSPRARSHSHGSPAEADGRSSHVLALDANGREPPDLRMIRARLDHVCSGSDSRAADVRELVASSLECCGRSPRAAMAGSTERLQQPITAHVDSVDSRRVIARGMCRRRDAASYRAIHSGGTVAAGPNADNPAGEQSGWSSHPMIHTMINAGSRGR